MRQLLSDKKVSVFCHIWLAILVIPYVLLYDKHQSLLFINSYNSANADLILYHITRLPELAMIVFVILLSMFYERRIFLSVILGMSICGLSIILFKHFLFSDFERPFKWLSSSNIPFHRVYGIRLHSNGSFPSGHTLAAFASLGFAGFISKNGFVQFVLFILACACAYSRVYVAQHYLRDVYAGALIGYGIALFTYSIFQIWFKTPYWKKPFIRFIS